MPRDLLMGIDVREHPAGPDAEWSDARRQTYLLRPEIARPLSCDRRVWRACRLADGAFAECLPWVGVEGVRQRAVGPCALIAISLRADSVEDEARARARGCEGEVEVGPGWRFVGFDVADDAISGLSNCGYRQDEVGDLRATWAPRLNAHGLFEDVADALSFRGLTDERVPEHAPFAVHGIWIVELLA
jgi:hypothetical protein